VAWTDGLIEARHFFHLETWESFPIALGYSVDYTVVDTRIRTSGYTTTHPTKGSVTIVEFHHLVYATSSQHPPIIGPFATY
jgi:hypothetical protein